jgi:hypothetical protein
MRFIPTRYHAPLDYIVAGALLATSPWVFGYADDGAKSWVPFVVIGVAAVFLGFTTQQASGYRYRRPGARRGLAGAR